MQKNITHTFLLSILPFLLAAQTFQNQSFKVTSENNELINPFSGGLNAPQFSEVDLNGDGLKDLYAFDREGDVHLTFLKKENGGNFFYEYEPSFARNFPNTTQWVLLRDYNGDDIEDLFTFAGIEDVDGIRVFKGKYTNGKIAFDRVALNSDFQFNVLSYPINDNLTNQIIVKDIDYPGMIDVNGDSDLDILTYGGGDKHVFYFENQAVENGYPLDSLVYELADDCWGRFNEASNNQVITLSNDISICADGFWNGPPSTLHPGSTLTPFDEDGDGDMEIIIGDNVNPFLIKLTNTGDANTAFMTDQDTQFPNYDVPVILPFFVNTFHLDVDHDGLKDLIAATNTEDISENKNLSLFYKNVGTAEEVVLEWQQNDWLVDGMIDFGDDAYPVFVDVNGDELLDLVVGNGTFYLPAGEKDTRLFLFENTGTANNPEFALTDDDWLNFGQFSSATQFYAPTFGDLDGDGDLDLLVGERFGQLFYANNTGGTGNPMQFESIVPQWQDINVGTHSIPQIMDLNGDDLPDLLIGERNGLLNFFPNQGTANNPIFHPEADEAPNDNFFGGIDVAFLLPNSLAGYASPHLVQLENEILLLIGTETGEIIQTSFTPQDVNEDFEIDNLNWGNIEVGQFSNLAIADINNDAVLDVFVGNRRGGLTAFKSNLFVDGTTPSSGITRQSPIQVFPNPSSDVLFIEGLNNNITPNILIYNQIGILVQQEKGSKISLENLPTGIYFLEVEGQIFRLIKM